jgi:hypothetical protein
MPAKAAKVKVEVRADMLYHDGHGYPKGAILEVSAEDAKTLMGRGEAGRPGGLAAERKSQEDAEASRPRCSNCGRLLRDGMGDPCPGCARALAEPLADPLDPDLALQSFLSPGAWT